MTAAQSPPESANALDGTDAIRVMIARENVELRHRIDALERDARRYRWLRKRANTWNVRKFCHNFWKTLMTDELDAAIDAALANEGAAGGGKP